MNTTRITVTRENGQKAHVLFSDDWNLHLTEYEWLDQKKLAHLIANKYKYRGVSDYFLVVDDLHFQQDKIVFRYCCFGQIGLESFRSGSCSVQELLRVTDEDCTSQQVKCFQADTFSQVQEACWDIPAIAKYEFGFRNIYQDRVKEKKAEIYSPGCFAAIPGQDRYNQHIRDRQQSWTEKCSAVDEQLIALERLAEQCGREARELDELLQKKLAEIPEEIRGTEDVHKVEAHRVYYEKTQYDLSVNKEGLLALQKRLKQKQVSLSEMQRKQAQDYKGFFDGLYQAYLEDVQAKFIKLKFQLYDALQNAGKAYARYISGKEQLSEISGGDLAKINKRLAPLLNIDSRGANLLQSFDSMESFLCAVQALIKSRDALLKTPFREFVSAAYAKVAWCKEGKCFDEGALQVAIELVQCRSFEKFEKRKKEFCFALNRDIFEPSEKELAIGKQCLAELKEVKERKKRTLTCAAQQYDEAIQQILVPQEELDRDGRQHGEQRLSKEGSHSSIEIEGIEPVDELQELKNTLKTIRQFLQEEQSYLNSVTFFNKDIQVKKTVVSKLLSLIPEDERLYNLDKYNSLLNERLIKTLMGYCHLLTTTRRHCTFNSVMNFLSCGLLFRKTGSGQLWQKRNFLAGFQNYKAALASGEEVGCFSALEKIGKDNLTLSDTASLTDLDGVEKSLSALKF